MPIKTIYRISVDATCDACGKEQHHSRDTDNSGLCYPDLPPGVQSFLLGIRAVTLCELCSKKAVLRVDDKSFPLLT